jgi:hypothetical protein
MSSMLRMYSYTKTQDLQYILVLVTPHDAHANHEAHYDFSLSLLLSSVAVLGLLDLDSAAFWPSCASRSRKSLHNSAKDSLLVGVALSSCVLKLGVLGVRLNGLDGIRSDEIDVGPAPGLAKPACSFCSAHRR